MHMCVCVCVCVYIYIYIYIYIERERGTNLNANACDLKLLLLQSPLGKLPHHYEYSVVSVTYALHIIRYISVQGIFR